MLAVSTDDFSVFVIDCDVKRVVRQFNCHTNKISDMVTIKIIIESKQRCELKTILRKI